MSNTYTPPEITVEFRADEYGHPVTPWTLMATTHSRTEIVGPRIPRILRGSGTLSIDVRHATKEQAEQAATKLRAYLGALGKEKKVKGEQVAETRKKGFWED